jgi:hypothetical protein
VLSAVHRNTELLEKILLGLQRGYVSHSGSADSGEGFGAANEDALEAVDENVRLRRENDELVGQINDLRYEVDLLTKRNIELESVASSAEASNQAAPVELDDSSLSWEERKQRILDQLENDTFDAENFLSQLQSENREDQRLADRDDMGARERAIEYIHQLHTELHELRRQVEHYREHAQHLAAIENAPDTSSILDEDEVIQAERERLRELEAEWEEKFRRSEIEASLERAKLARQRMEVEQKNRLLEQRISELENQLKSGDRPDAGTRWMAKLGLLGNRSEE